MAIEFLDKGKLWEKAIELIRDLRIQYETVSFEYQKLADILVGEKFVRDADNCQAIGINILPKDYYN